MNEFPNRKITHMRLIFTSLLLLVFCTSCNFNKTFLYPTEFPPELKHITISTPNDTTIINIDSSNYQPTIVSSNGRLINLGYTIESVKFKSENENYLVGWMLKSKTIAPQTTLLHFHGNAGSIVDQHRVLVPLLDKGFQVFVIDYSGFGFSEGEATRENVLIDGNSTLKYLVTRKDIENTKLVIYGQSLGGHLAAVVGQQNQSIIDGIVIEGAFSSHKDIGKERAGFLGKLFIKEQYSALESIQKFDKPVLIIHSSEDEVIPFKLGKKLYEHANEPKEFYKISGCHICGPSLFTNEIALRINKMLNL